MRRRFPITILFLSGLFFFHFASFAPFAVRAEAGATWYVDDDAPNDPGPGTTTVSDRDEDGTPDHPFDAIQKAIEAASDGDTIIVRDGTYTGGGNRDIHFGGKAVHLMSENGPENCIVDAEGSHRVFQFASGEGADSILDGFTLTGGLKAWGGSGGGVYCDGASPTIINNTITGNTAHNAYGGGIFCYNGSPTIMNNTITGNTAYNREGGGIYCSSSSPTISNNTISGNTADLAGGGIYCDRGSPTITNNTMTANTAEDDGGGIYCYYSSPTITRNTVTANTASYGGGIYCAGSSPTITNNNITANTTTDNYGGGIYCTGSSPTITNNTIGANTASYGGGIYCIGGSATITKNTVTANTAYYGGAIYCSTNSATISKNTMSGNTADSRGGGICCTGGAVTVITNTILWSNSAIGSGNQIYVDGSAAVTVRYSDVSAEASATYVGEGSTLAWEVGYIDVDPLFADPANGDYHLRSKYGRWDPAANDGAGGWLYDEVMSPCIDAGDPGLDFSNELQPNGGQVNMGAYGNTPEASKSAYLLAVESAPVAGVGITGDRPGTTNYATACEDDEEVNLSAPATVTVNGATYDFIRWTVDGADQPVGQANVALIMEAHHTAAASYALVSCELAVQSAPIAGVGITGDKPGVTNYVAACAPQEVVNLAAPPAATDGGVSYNFVRWTVDGADQPAGQCAIEITMDSAHTAAAVYEIQTHTLTVQSTPITGIEITGDKPGVTDYAAVCDDQEVVELTALGIATNGEGARYNFVCWEGHPEGATSIQITMGADHTAVAVYEIQTHTLTVQSAPIAGINITGDAPGVTDYAATCDDQQLVSLTAPASATTAGGVRYSFVRWEGYPHGQATIEITMDADRTAVATYEILTHTLSVQSTPITGVEVSGDRPGTTDYAAVCDDQEAVDLTAPDTQVVSDVHYGFSRWVLDDADQPEGETGVHVLADADHTAVAVYEIEAYILSVQSVGITGVNIAGDRPGVTHYTALCNVGEAVNLTAPMDLTDSGARYNFVCWIVDGAIQPVGEPALEVTMDAVHTAEAVYDIWTHTLTVESSPITGVGISGDEPGLTNYAATCSDQVLVALEAPSSETMWDGVEYGFVRWVLDGAEQPALQTGLEVRMDADHTAIAVYYGAVSRLIIEGPNERREGILPFASGTAPGALGEVAVDLYAEGFPGFAGFQATLDFLDDLLAECDGFSIAYNNIPPNSAAAWGDRKIVHNDLFLPVIQEVYEGQTFGLLTTEREPPGPPDWQPGPYVDKSIPPGGRIDPQTGQPYGRTWLMSVTCWYSPDVGAGTCTIGADEITTTFGDRDSNELPYEVSAGSLTIGILGDANGDCVVNILDMILIRNLLGLDTGTDDNWKADVTRDGRIDVLDMLVVRNNLNTTCPE